MDFNKIKEYWEDIPIGRANAVTYEALCKKWKVSRRQARNILHELSVTTFDLKYVLIRSSHWTGFYKTANIEEIEAFKLECLSRGHACLAPITKINKVLNNI